MLRHLESAAFYNPEMPTAASFVAKHAILIATLLCASQVMAQQAASPPEPLAIQTTSLSKANLHEPYGVHLQAEGGLPPLRWELTAGSLPEGLTLDMDGLLSGAPDQTGEFQFTVTVSDNSRPSQQQSRAFSLRVVVPLFLKWSRTPAVSDHRIEGAIKVSNQTDYDFDLTVIVVAINESGRATALGYQHFVLKKDSEEMEIPFGETLPPGSYQVNVDAVAEVLETHTIHRARLAVNEPLQIVQSP